MQRVGIFLLCFSPLFLGAQDFLRGDADRDGRVLVTDAIYHLLASFGADVRLRCEDAADSNDDGRLDLSDVVTTLSFLFTDAPELPFPGAFARGPDPSCDALGCADRPRSAPAIVLSEIHYNPAGADERLEFIELHNRTGVDLDLRGHRISGGVRFSFVEETVVPAGGYFLVVKEPGLAGWRRLDLKAGPYTGFLANGGERIRLLDGDCELESLRYADSFPWPNGADGYGPSLERVDVESPAEDPHSWRASSAPVVGPWGGTPGAPNASAGTPTHPLLAASRATPEHPRSPDAVTVELGLDVPAAAIESATVRWQRVSGAVTDPQTLGMELGDNGLDWAWFSATIPPGPSSTLVRYNFRVELADGSAVLLPHTAESPPVLSYFVEDGETVSRLPILSLFARRASGLTENRRLFAGAVIREPGAEAPQVLDGVDLRSSRGGLTLKFLKGAEYRGDRSVKIVPERGGGGSGTRAPHMEQLGFELWRDLGGLAPWARWFRVVENGDASRQSQRVLIEHINERFFALNGVDPDGDLYKLDHYNGFVPDKKTHRETGNESYRQLLRALASDDLEATVDLDSVRSYSVISELLDNWDGFHQNYYFYHDLTPGGRWRVIPWDLDQVFGCVTFPITFPLDGRGTCVSRAADRRIFSEPYHRRADLDALYRDALRGEIDAGGGFSEETVLGKIDAVESLLLEDLELLEAQLEAGRGARRAQILDACRAIRSYVERRVPFLRGVLE